MGKIGSYIIAILLLLLTIPVCYSEDVRLPEGWRIPTKPEIKEKWRNKDINRYLWIKADFNGDGIMDQARLLINDHNHEIGLFAFVSQKDNLIKTFLLDKKSLNYIKVLGIAIVSRGRHQTVCGKEIIECGKEEPKEINLTYEAIDYFKFESARMYFYWDELIKTFKSVGIED